MQDLTAITGIKVIGDKCLHLNTSILDTPSDFIIHCCNCFHTMGAGVALSLRQQWPQIYAADKKTNYGDETKLGDFSKAFVNGSNNKTIVVYNLYGQYMYGRTRAHLDYYAVRTGLNNIRNDIEEHTKNWVVLPMIAFPEYMGCRNAGGDWDKVYKIITEVFTTNNYILTFHNYDNSTRKAKDNMGQSASACKRDLSSIISS